MWNSRWRFEWSLSIAGSAEPGALLIEPRDRGGGGFDSDLLRSLEFPLLRSTALQAFAPVARRGLSAARALAAQLLQVLMKFIVDLVGHGYLLDTTSHHFHEKAKSS